MNRGICVLLLVLFSPTFLRAEPSWQPGSRAASDAVQSDKRLAVSVLRRDQHLRVVLGQTATSHEGNFVLARGDTLLMDVDGQVIAIPVATVSELWVHERSVKGGAFVGAIAGLSVAAFVTVLAVATNSQSFTTGDDYIITVGLYTLTGATIGALAGLKERWQQRYP